MFWTAEKSEAVEPEAEAESEWIRPSNTAPRYSQPLASTFRHCGEEGVLYSGFVNGEVGFILRRGAREKPIQVEASAANRANEHPKGFFASLGRLWAGSRT